ncbi:ParA family protein [Listeria booriae]|uniref:ParA family protein n=1 Tax=Listeria booriae TaxID=1552123 RepID=A0A7X0XB47_9LIST|nr:ParA family protein [Listeria booriae]MBC1490928.1 ParA family protein [Listeria booriae]MBC1491157.1 ParA family protein [Listeria booriae]MBC6151011.1 ParA family protein [Listeria booriae]MBC6151240.1 ParA family protein [Listeria booriae]
MVATVYTVGNFKGGVGKTKIVTMLGYDNAVIRGKKTLVLDLDPQANASQILAKTANIDNIERTVTQGLQENDFSICITPIVENLDLIACDTGFRSFNKYVLKNFETEEEQINVLNKLIEPLKANYDAIFIDVPPTISEFSDNAMAASDYSIIAFQTVIESLDGVAKYVGYQNFMVERYGIDLQIIDIIPCMVEPDDSLDKEILNEARELYGNVVSENVVNYQKRLRRYSSEGIYIQKYNNGNYDQWDFNAHNIFTNILNELEGRKNYLTDEMEA